MASAKTRDLATATFRQYPKGRRNGQPFDDVGLLADTRTPNGQFNGGYLTCKETNSPEDGNVGIEDALMHDFSGEEGVNPPRGMVAMNKTVGNHFIPVTDQRSCYTAAQVAMTQRGGPFRDPVIPGGTVVVQLDPNATNDAVLAVQTAYDARRTEASGQDENENENENENEQNVPPPLAVLQIMGGGPYTEAEVAHARATYVVWPDLHVVAMYRDEGQRLAADVARLANKYTQFMEIVRSLQREAPQGDPTFMSALDAAAESIREDPTHSGIWQHYQRQRQLLMDRLDTAMALAVRCAAAIAHAQGGTIVPRLEAVIARSRREGNGGVRRCEEFLHATRGTIADLGQAVDTLVMWLVQGDDVLEFLFMTLFVHD
jgi:hypothetical protein